MVYGSSVRLLIFYHQRTLNMNPKKGSEWLQNSNQAPQTSKLANKTNISPYFSPKKKGNPPKKAKWYPQKKPINPSPAAVPQLDLPAPVPSPAPAAAPRADPAGPPVAASLRSPRRRRPGPQRPAALGPPVAPALGPGRWGWPEKYDEWWLEEIISYYVTGHLRNLNWRYLPYIRPM